MNDKWILRRNRKYYDILEHLINKTIKQRFTMDEFLANLSALIDPFKFKDMHKAVATITDAIKSGKTICVYADYDVDGTTSCYTTFMLIGNLINFMKSTSQIGYYIPHREKEGYGINTAALDKIRKTGFDLIITVDNGIASASQVDYGKSIGLDFVVTDHHEYPDVIPDCPIINPHDGVYPFTKLSGCGTVFKMLEALYVHNGFPKGLVYEYLDITAISTIADMMDLVGENRIIVKYGLMLLNRNFAMGTRPWFNQLVEKAKYNKAYIDAETIGFTVGPRINSVGRLSHSRNTLQFMLEKDMEKLAISAKHMNDLNDERKDEQDEIVKLGDAQVEEMGVENSINVVVDGKVGVVGLAASNLLDKYYRPTTVFSSALSSEVYKASARSIEGFNYFEEVIQKNRDIIVGGGGHAMAAGLAVRAENIGLFKERVNQAVEDVMKKNPDLLVRKRYIESELYPSDIDLALIRKIDQMEPYGMGNKKPVFMLKNMAIKEVKGVPTKDPKHLQVTFMNGDSVFKGILFKRADLMGEIISAGTVDVAFTLGVNSFLGKTDIQLVLEDYKVSGTEEYVIEE